MFVLLRLITLVLGAALVATAAAQIQGDIKQFGFSGGSGATRLLVREGQWAPVVVQLAVQGSQPFQGKLRCQCSDLDGDRVAFIEEPVTLTPSAGMKRFWGYAVTFSENLNMASAAPGLVNLDVLNDAGDLVVRFPLPGWEYLDNDTLLVVDISDQPVVGLSRLQGLGLPTDEEGYRNVPRLYRNAVVGKLSALDLPDRWFGLEAVNVLVWDQPDPDALTNAQLEALIQWVNNGGQLVVGLGSAWNRVQKSRLAAIMPVQGDGPVVTVNTLTTFFQKMVDPTSKMTEFKQPVAIATPAPAPHGVVTYRDTGAGRQLNIVTMGNVGSGRVVAVAARLPDLTARDMTARFLYEIIDFNRKGDDFYKHECDRDKMAGLITGSSHALFGDLTRPVDFGAIGGLFLFAAILFVIAYIGVATLVSWWWLRQHALTQLSWTVFAVFAVIASALGIGAVGLTHGVFGEVRGVSLVDLSSGATEARAYCLFGYRSPRRQRIDFTLPGDGNYLRAMARGGGTLSVYATAERYDAIPNRALLANTPLRATLKQFEGFWHGQLDGSIRARLTADQISGRITPDSWIANDLPTGLAGGYLLYLDPRDGYAMPGRVTSQTGSRLPKLKKLKDVPAAADVLVVEIPPLDPNGSQVSNLGAKHYADVDQALTRWQAQRDDNPLNQPELRTLFDVQSSWIGNLVSPSLADPTLLAALLLSTRSLYLNCSADDFQSVLSRLNAEGLLDRDITHWLLRGQAVLLLAATDGGPAHLCADGKPLKTKSGFTLYRVRCPIAYTRQAASQGN
jgi:hypothetical protein